MRSVTRYQANDGSEWDTAEKAHKRDAMSSAVDSAMCLLRDVPSELNWEGFVQQDPETIREVKRRLFEIANVHGVLKWWIDSQQKEHSKTENDLAQNCHPSWFVRLLDGGSRPLGIAYGRLCAIDEHGREWNQPYYANNPPKGAVEVTGA